MNDLDLWRPRLVSIAMDAGNADGVHDGARGDLHDGAHDLAHLHRVWQTATKLLADYPQADAMVVQAACYLHDIVNLPKNHRERHQASCLAAKRACAKLVQAGFPQDRLESVGHAIEAHSFSARIEPVTIEAKIVQDADRLDALGAVGLARMFYTAGRMGSALAHPDDPLALQRPLDDRAFALDHVENKLASLPGTMQTAAGRKLSETRLAWLRSFCDTFVAEWGKYDNVTNNV